MRKNNINSRMKIWVVVIIKRGTMTKKLRGLTLEKIKKYFIGSLI